MKGEHGPLFPLQQTISVNIPKEIDHKKDHNGLEPSGIVNVNPCCFGTVPAFHKGSHGHCRSKNQKKNSHKSCGKKRFFKNIDHGNSVYFRLAKIRPFWNLPAVKTDKNHTYLLILTT